MKFTAEMWDTYKLIDSMNAQQRNEFFSRLAEIVGKDTANSVHEFYFTMACMDWRNSEFGRTVKDYIGATLYKRFNGGDC